MREAQTSVVERISRRWGADPRESRENARAPRSTLRTGRTWKRRISRVEEFLRTQRWTKDGVGEDGPQKTS
jgi:hypothetical protein